MTLGQYMRVFARRWYIVLGVLLLTAGAAFLVSRTSGVYSSQATVRLITPTLLSEGESAIGTTTEGLVDFAALVVKEVMGNSTDLRFASPDATLAGAGVREGLSVRVLDTGGQWSANYENPVIVVDAVGANADEVRATMESTVQQITEIIDERETVAGVTADARVGVLISPEEFVVGYVKGNRTRALGATALFGVGTAAVLAVSVDLFFSRRRLAREALVQRPTDAGAPAASV